MERGKGACCICNKGPEVLILQCHKICRECIKDHVGGIIASTYTTLFTYSQSLNRKFELKCPFNCENSVSIDPEMFENILYELFSSTQKTWCYIDMYFGFSAYFHGVETRFWVCKSCKFVNGAIAEEEGGCAQCGLLSGEGCELLSGEGCELSSKEGCELLTGDRESKELQSYLVQQREEEKMSTGACKMNRKNEHSQSYHLNEWEGLNGHQIRKMIHIPENKRDPYIFSHQVASWDSPVVPMLQQPTNEPVNTRMKSNQEMKVPQNIHENEDICTMLGKIACEFFGRSIEVREFTVLTDRDAESFYDEFFTTKLCLVDRIAGKKPLTLSKRSKNKYLSVVEVPDITPSEMNSYGISENDREFKFRKQNLYLTKFLIRI